MVLYLAAIVVALPPSFGVMPPMPCARQTLEPSMTETYPGPKKADSDKRGWVDGRLRRGGSKDISRLQTVWVCDGRLRPQKNGDNMFLSLLYTEGLNHFIDEFEF